MKKIILSILSISFSSTFLFAQWTTSGNDIYNSNSGNVGIGISSPSRLLHLSDAGSPSIRIDDEDDGRPGIITVDNSVMSIGMYGDGTPNGVINFLNGSGSGTERMRIDDNGNVGIGTTAPTQDLDVAGAAVIGQTSTTENGGVMLLTKGTRSGLVWHKLANVNTSGQIGVILAEETGTSSTPAGLVRYGSTHATYPSMLKVGTMANNDLFFVTNNVDRIHIENSGNVGIGTTAPEETLHVNGTVLVGDSVPTDSHTDYLMAVDGKGVFKELVVLESSEWADYVFNEDYKLRSLDDVRNFIKKNNHLPDVPSAKEVNENGISLGQMEATLLRKIEELTLYVLELEKKAKRVDKLEKMVNELMSK